MESIDPILPSVTRGMTAPPVERLERVSRERDRPARRDRQQPRREAEVPPRAPDGPDDDDEDRPRVDVRV